MNNTLKNKVFTWVNLYIAIAALMVCFYRYYLLQQIERLENEKDTLESESKNLHKESTLNNAIDKNDAEEYCGLCEKYSHIKNKITITQITHYQSEESARLLRFNIIAKGLEIKNLDEIFNTHYVQDGMVSTKQVTENTYKTHNLFKDHNGLGKVLKIVGEIIFHTKEDKTELNKLQQPKLAKMIKNLSNITEKNTNMDKYKNVHLKIKEAVKSLQKDILDIFVEHNAVMLKQKNRIALCQIALDIEHGIAHRSVSEINYAIHGQNYNWNDQCSFTQKVTEMQNKWVEIVDQLNETADSMQL